MIALKQSTSYTFRIGPFLDDTDGKTAESALTITRSDIRLSKAGGNFAQRAAVGTLTHDEVGWYILTIDATDTNTVGSLIVAIHMTGALPVWVEYQVLEEDTYAFLYASGATPDADVADILADTNELQADDTPGAIAAVQSDTDDIQTRLPAALVGGAIDADISAVQAGAIDDAAVGADLDTYQMKIWLIIDGATDRYAVAFYKNGAVITTGITFGAGEGLWVVEMTATPDAGLVGTEGTPQALAETNDALEMWFHNETSGQTVPGTQYMARVNATIDGAERIFYQPVGRDA